MRGQLIAGRIATGVGFGKYFTRLDWAREQFVGKLGIDPFPGTVNLIVEDAASLKVWSLLSATPGIQIDNPNDGPHDCDARCYPVLIDDGIEAAIVLPEVQGYAADQIEVITATAVRATLSVKDGDTLRLTIR